MRKRNAEILAELATVNDGAPTNTGYNSWESSDSGTDQFQGLFDDTW